MGGVREVVEVMEDNSAAVALVQEPAQKPAPVTAIQKQAMAAVPANDGIAGPFSSENAFMAAQRMGQALAASTLVPQQYQKNLANCLIAMELASRIGVSVLATMQNLHVIQGRPSWSSAFLIATVNASGRFTPLRYEWGGKAGTASWACRAHAKDRASGETLIGAWITWEMATKEGWTKKSGSKWLTMPEQMFQYRAAAFWCRVYCPEISIGFQTQEEVMDTSPVHGSVLTDESALPAGLTPAGAKALEAVLGVQSEAEQFAEPAAEQEPEAAKPEVSKSGILFNKNFHVAALRGKPLEDATAEQRAEYQRYLGSILADASKASAHAAVSAHKSQVDLLIEQIAADDALGNGPDA